MSKRTACVYPGLDLAKEPAGRAPAYARLDGRKGIVGNGFFEIQIDYRHDNLGIGSFLNKITGDVLDVEFVPFHAWFNEGNVNAREMAFGRIHARGTASIATLATCISHKWFDADILLVVRKGVHFAQKTVIFHNVTKGLLLERISLCRHHFPGDVDILVHDAGAWFPVVFVRGKGHSLFYCGDHPGYFAAKESGRRFSFDYFPGERLEPGRTHQTLSARMGICRHEGRWTHNPFHETGVRLDVGEAQWFRAHLTAHAPPAELPYVEMCGADEQGGGLCDAEAVEQAARLGVRHVFLPRWLGGVDANPYTTRLTQRLRATGGAATVMISHEGTDRPGWTAVDSDGRAVSPGPGPCLACEPFRTSLLESYEALLDQHGFSNAEVRAAPIVACHSDSHGHQPGSGSLQKAFQGMADIAEALRENCGHVRCAGAYGSYGAGIARMFDSIPLLAPPHPLPLPDLHIERMFADMGRLYYRRSRSFLVPRANLSNSVGLPQSAALDGGYPGADQHPWRLYHDRAGWQYGLISAIATGIRHTLHTVPHQLRERDVQFVRKWLDWEKEHVDELRESEELLDNPGLGAVDAYACASARSAFVFLFNSSYDDQEATLRLRLSHDCEYIVREIYPREMNYLGPAQGLFQRDSDVAVQLGPKEARIIEAVRRSPASAKRKRPEVFGAECVEHRHGTFVKGEPGVAVQIGVRLKNEFSLRDVQFPGKRHVRHIRRWRHVCELLERGTEMLAGGFDGEPLAGQTGVLRNAWLTASFEAPADLGKYLNLTTFTLNRPPWALPDRLFFVVRFEPPPLFEPIRTSSACEGVPEAHMGKIPIQCGIDLAPANMSLAAWVNGRERTVYPAQAPWNGWNGGRAPVTAYFFEAGSCLELGASNQVVLYANRMEVEHFRGIFMEHYPQMTAETTLKTS